jgi:hypothetical protein
MVQYPPMRRELIVTIRALADVDYQCKVWVNHRSPVTPWYDSLDDAIHVIFDDMSLDTRLEQAVA